MTMPCPNCGVPRRWVNTDRGRILPITDVPDDHPPLVGDVVIREDGRGHVVVEGDVMPPGVLAFHQHACA